MGHALEKAHRLLKPGGVLIEIHFSGELTSLEVHAEGQVKFVERLHQENFVAYKQAKAALDRAIHDGLFLPVAEQSFDDLVYADSFDALCTWLAENVKSITLDNKVARKVDALVERTAGPAKVVLRRQVRMGRLKRG